MEEKKEAPNWFVRILSLAFLGFLSGLVVASFFFTEPKFGITSGILSVIGIMTVLILAEAFHTLSVGKILTLSRQVKDAEKEKGDLKKDNADLRASLINLATNVHQSQVTTNISGADLPLLRQALGVIPTAQSEEEEEEEDAEESGEHATWTAVAEQERRDDWETKRRLHEALDEILLQKFLTKYSLSGLELLKNVEFGTGIESVDPIMNRRLVYDGYIKTTQKEYFIEARANRAFHLMWADRMYVMLAKVFFYRQAKKTDAELVLLIPAIPENVEEHQDRWRNTRMLEWFQPAISNGLLRVESFPITEAEYDQLKKEAREGKRE